MKKEVKIGILALVTIIGAVWGYSFLKGRNLLTNSYTFYSKFQNVDQLPVSAPVLVSGVQVGTVSRITLDPADMKTVIVQMDVENISPYLIPGRNVIISSRNKSLSDFPLMVRGSSPVDGGNLILNEEERRFLFYLDSKSSLE